MTEISNFVDTLTALVVGLMWLWAFLAVLALASLAVLAINGGVAISHQLDSRRTGSGVRRG